MQASIWRRFDHCGACRSCCEQLVEQQANRTSIIVAASFGLLTPRQVTVGDCYLVTPQRAPVFKVVEIARQGKVVYTHQAAGVANDCARYHVTMAYAA